MITKNELRRNLYNETKMKEIFRQSKESYRIMLHESWKRETFYFWTCIISWIIILVLSVIVIGE